MGFRPLSFRAVAALLLEWPVLLSLSAVSPASSPVVYNTHKRRRDLEARLQILPWDLSITCWAWISYSLEAHLAVNFLERNLER